MLDGRRSSSRHDREIPEGSLTAPLARLARQPPSYQSERDWEQGKPTRRLLFSERPQPSLGDCWHFLLSLYTTWSASGAPRSLIAEFTQSLWKGVPDKNRQRLGVRGCLCGRPTHVGNNISCIWMQPTTVSTWRGSRALSLIGRDTKTMSSQRAQKHTPSSHTRAV